MSQLCTLLVNNILILNYVRLTCKLINILQILTYQRILQQIWKNIKITR